MKTVLTTLGISLLVLAGCAGQKQAESNFIQENIDNAVAQETIQTDIIEKSGKILNPRTIDKDGNIVYVPIDDWCSGFFPGNIWHMYELTGDQKWLPLAEKYTEDLDSVQYLTWHHDVGFMIGSSYLNGYRFAGKEEYKPVIIQTAKSLSTRFRPAAGVLQSWDADKGWQAERGWKCPVIIDNMMNLELLFEASKLSGDSTFYNIARKHADTTMKSVRDRLHKAMPTSLLGHVDKRGPCTAIPCAIAIHTMPNTWNRLKRSTTLSSTTRIFRKTWFPTGISMLPISRMNLAMLRQLPARRPPFTS